MLGPFGLEDETAAWPRSAWVISDGTMGMLSQSLAVVRAMDIGADDIRALPSPLLRLYPRLAHLPGWQLTWGREPNWLRANRFPDLMITCGRRMAGLSIGIRRRSRGKTRTVHIQDANLPPHLFDLMIVPAHDRLASIGKDGAPPDNVIVSTGSLNRLNKDDISEAASDFDWPEQLDRNRPVIAVMLGGRNKRYAPNAEQCRELASQLEALASQTGGQLVLIPSRRTSSSVRSVLNDRFRDSQHIIWDQAKPNPYPAILAISEMVVVTSDSANMTTEACITGLPVLTAHFRTEQGKIARFHHLMQERNHTQNLSDILSGAAQLNKAPAVLDEMPLIAEQIFARLSPEP